MKSSKKIVIALAVVVVVALLGGGAYAAFGGDDDATARGTCGPATYEISRESDDEGLEVAFELQSAAPGETWNLRVLQGDTPILTGERTTDEDAELDVDAPADEAAGLGFTVEATSPSGEVCTARLAG